MEERGARARVAGEWNISMGRAQYLEKEADGKSVRVMLTNRRLLKIGAKSIRGQYKRAKGGRGKKIGRRERRW